MWNAHYIQTLISNHQLGANFNYVVEIPPIENGDVYVRIGLRAPSTGQCRVQAMYVGHGTGYSFDGNQVPVTVNGQTSFTLTGGQLVYSDPVLASDCGFDTTKPVLLAYSILNGDYYRGNTTLSSDYVLSWKTGTGDAGTTAKSGYTSAAGRTALLEKVEFTDTLEMPPEEPNDPEYPTGETLSGGSEIPFEQILAGEWHSTGNSRIEGQEGKYLHIQFINPAHSGKLAFYYEMSVTPTDDTEVSFRSHPIALSNQLPRKCNLFFGAGQGVMEGRYSHENSILGIGHSNYEIFKRSNRDVKPRIILNEGYGCVMVLHKKGAGATVNIHWREINKINE